LIGIAVKAWWDCRIAPPAASTAPANPEAIVEQIERLPLAHGAQPPRKMRGRRPRAFERGAGAFLADYVTTGRPDEDEAHEVAHDLAYRLPKRAYRL
jgi:hypothetical protein